ncbi:MAG: hypothetical protein ACI920_002728, partial [Saprospiraceae bacterium]
CPTHTPPLKNTLRAACGSAGSVLRRKNDFIKSFFLLKLLLFLNK